MEIYIFLIPAVIPVAAATMTPIPLTLGLIAMKLREFFTKRSEEKKVPIGNDDVKESESKQKLMINGNGNSCETNNGHV